MFLWRQDDRDFRDKITPISVVLEYTLDYGRAQDRNGLRPVLDVAAPPNVTRQVNRLGARSLAFFFSPFLTTPPCGRQAHILLDCGDDNVCKPDLRLSVQR